MLLQMALLLAVASTVVEGFIAWYTPGWRKLTKKFRLLDILFSFALSWAMGIMFGAQGLVICMAGIVSTMISMPMYPLMDWYEENAVEIKAGYYKLRQTLLDTAILVYKFLRLLTLPIRGIRWCSVQYSSAKDALRKEGA